MGLLSGHWLRLLSKSTLLSQSTSLLLHNSLCSLLRQYRLSSILQHLSCFVSLYSFLSAKDMSSWILQMPLNWPWFSSIVSWSLLPSSSFYIWFHSPQRCTRRGVRKGVMLGITSADSSVFVLIRVVYGYLGYIRVYWWFMCGLVLFGCWIADLVFVCQSCQHLPVLSVIPPTPCSYNTDSVSSVICLLCDSDWVMLMSQLGGDLMFSLMKFSVFPFVL